MEGYNGYLMAIGDYILPLSKIQADSYQVQLIVQDLDTYTDANGELHRNALEHKVAKVEFLTVPMTDKEFGAFMKNLSDRYENPTERSFYAQVYIPETNSYTEAVKMYMADVQPQIYFADSNKLMIRPTRIAFIGY